MPELPEVETVRRSLADALPGRTIVGVTQHTFTAALETSLPGIDPGPSLIGSRFERVDRRGKYLILPLSTGLLLVIHLRMTGRVLLTSRHADRVRFEHLALHLDSGSDLRFADQRKFGRVSIVNDAYIARLDSRLGPEPFDPWLTGTTLHQKLKRRPGKIKNVLLDQDLIAGLGNIYVDEALYRTRIHPEQPARSLDRNDCTRLLRAIRLILRLAIDRQGTTFSSFENPYGEAGTNAAFLKAYGRSRTGERCPRCGTPFERLVVGGRGTTICPRCQVLRDLTFAKPTFDPSGAPRNHEHSGIPPDSRTDR
ncbi:MAG: Formamidopyrimidine-DNA glycosylase [uncultured Thermomicrobiales bacterium]|uniref:Formamidopyrimidine-DNA glycosylase n=1 Tax=uncultured Thermomicrobiales bacterium TaxID=1645740 RepID=A0A6J4UZC9_9BACT|nr:MAG: Formamidopyrimidine-DNA glycosylase [uncultured Thermomicrobiales bacterium]